LILLFPSGARIFLLVFPGKEKQITNS
jgi:hypothetical protein